MDVGPKGKFCLLRLVRLPIVADGGEIETKLITIF